MIEFIDPFGRQTLFEFTISAYNKRISFAMRKERQSIYESIELNTAKDMIRELQIAIQVLESNG